MVELIKVLGPMGFILWLVHRVTTHTMPRLAQSYLESEEKARQDFKEMLSHQREAFTEEMHREREVHGQYVERIISALTSMRS